MFHREDNTFVMYRVRYTFYNVLLNSITLMEYLTSHYTTFRNTHYEKIKLLEYIARKVEVFEYIVRPDLMCARHLFNTAMANTNRCNPNAMYPADRCPGGHADKGSRKEGAPPARRSARTNRPSASDVDPSLRKPPPKSIPHAPGAGMPSLVQLGDVPPARAAPPYPLRKKQDTGSQSTRRHSPQSGCP
jgi:hypothetical protein